MARIPEEVASFGHRFFKTVPSREQAHFLSVIDLVSLISSRAGYLGRRFIVKMLIGRRHAAESGLLNPSL
jgi:hypothetical protein